MKKLVGAKKIAGGLVIGGLLLGGGGLALATNNDIGSSNSTQSSQPICGSRMPGMNVMNSQLMQSVLADLVANGTLTQQQVDQIGSKQNEIKSERQAWWKDVKKSLLGKGSTDQELTRPPKTDLFASLVQDGTITQSQADAINSAVKAKMSAQRQDKLQSNLNNLVANKVINNDQSVAILTKLSEQQTQRQDKREDLGSMTPEQRKEFRQENRSAKINPLADLVANGTITQEQADQVMKALRPAGGPEMHRGNGRPK